MQSTEPPEDIPVAMRDTPVKPQAPSPYRLVWVVSGAIGAIALTILSVTLWILSHPPSPSPGANAGETPVAGSSGAIADPNTDPNTNPNTNPNTDPLDPSSTSAETPDSSDPTTLLGHRPYAEAPPETLVPVLADGSLKLREAAARAWFALEEDAQKAGVSLMVLSAFRSHADQEYLFFEVKRQRGQDATTRAEVSAPPGYSEHHTGYALDIGDSSSPETYLNPDFENTAAFRWLKDNASFYGFELSFPPDNEQGISYEPWHWRFVGDQDSLETFYREDVAVPTVSPTP